MLERFKNSKIPIWVNVMQVILILIMLQQVFMFIFDHESVAAAGIFVDGSSANQNLLYEFAARTAVIALASLVVVILQNPKFYLVILFMNILREGFETIIDPLNPLENAPVSPTTDFLIHIVIVAIEVFAFVTVWRIVKKMDGKAEA